MSYHSQTERTTTAQRTTILLLLDERQATQFLVEYDDDHDTHCFVTFFRDGAAVYETVLEADGTEAD